MLLTLMFSFHNISQAISFNVCFVPIYFEDKIMFLCKGESGQLECIYRLLSIHANDVKDNKVESRRND